jgi:hypothetical protein
MNHKKLRGGLYAEERLQVRGGLAQAGPGHQGADGPAVGTESALVNGVSRTRLSYSRRFRILVVVEEFTPRMLLTGGDTVALRDACRP